MPGKTPRGEGIVKWISTEWLNAHLVNENLIIIDCQPDIHDYIKEHIPGARYLNERLFRCPEKGIPGKFIPGDAAQILFRRLGLKSSVATVVYTGTGPVKGWGDGLEQTMVAYTLARYGHENVMVLDGGIDKWKSEDRLVAQEFPGFEESTFTAKVQREFYILYDEFVETKDENDVVLIDARPPDVYEGQGPWIKPGHIPGAINLPWKNLMDPANTRLLKPEDDIRSVLEDKGIVPDKTIICSCGTGREATNEFILLKWYLGYPSVKIYEGSFTEWSSYPDNPTVTGPNPR
jgi:thiosulfate/3-mercaptopyruvate sulfurtransferase